MTLPAIPPPSSRCLSERYGMRCQLAADHVGDHSVTYTWPRAHLSGEMLAVRAVPDEGEDGRE